MMKKLLVFLLSAVMLLGISTSAMASTDRLTLSDGQIYGNASDAEYDNLRIYGSNDEKELVIEPSVLPFLEKNNLNIVLNLDDEITLTIAPQCFYTEQYKAAKNGSGSVGINLSCFTKEDLNTTSYTGSVANSEMIGYSGVRLEAWIVVDGVSTYQITTFAQPIKVSYEYDFNYIGYNYDETSSAMYWLDNDAAINSGVATFVKMPSTVNIEDDVISFEAPYGTGTYFPFAKSKAAAGNDTVAVDQLNGHWAQADIQQMQQKSIVPYDLSSIDINAAITRDEFTAYVVSTLNLDTDTSLVGKFSDIPASHQYYNAIYTAAAKGIINGYEDGTFRPDKQISRQEMAAILERALKIKGIELNYDAAALKAGVADYSSIAAWAANNCSAIYNSGLMGGKAEGDKVLFAPLANTTWAEAVVILNRLRVY